VGERLGSVVIPAHNEARVIGRCLGALLADVPAGTLEVVVVCNGCTDKTADVVRSTGLPVRVIEISQASKTAALSVADAETRAFPRLYLDADVVLPSSSAVAVLERLSWDDLLAARPPLRYDLAHCSPLVRRYYAARVMVPGMLDRLWGAGVYGMARSGRRRFDAWPDLTADDLFVDSLFSDDEIELVPADPVVVAPPRTAHDLLAVLRRGARAKADHQRGDAMGPFELPLRHTVGTTVRGLAGAVARRPAMLLNAMVYLGFATCARFRWTRTGSIVWERDHSSRSVRERGEGTRRRGP